VPPRSLFRVEAYGFTSDADGPDRKRFTITALVAGSIDDATGYTIAWFEAQNLTLGGISAMHLLRKAKGREGPGVVSVEQEHWAPAPLGDA
jgi:hypothetical protein